MTSKELNLKLITLLPELEPSYRHEIEWQDGDETGSHIVFEDILVPYLLDCIKNGDEEDIRKSFDSIETLLYLKDKYAEEVIAFSVIESLIFSIDIKEDLYNCMGNLTQKMFKEVFQNLKS